MYLKGVRIDVPTWAIILEAAGNDPLRAMELEAGVNQEWWERYVVYRTEQGKADQERERRMKRGT